MIKSEIIKKRLNNLYREYLNVPKKYDELESDIMHPLGEAMQLVDDALNYGVKDNEELLNEVFNLIEAAHTSAYLINRKIN